jgi:hypothetical protein
MPAAGATRSYQLFFGDESLKVWSAETCDVQQSGQFLVLTREKHHRQKVVLA